LVSKNRSQSASLIASKGLEDAHVVDQDVELGDFSRDGGGAGRPAPAPESAR
jgi:hypothetical protein